MTTLSHTTSSILTTVSRSADAVTKAVDVFSSGINIVHAHAQRAENVAIETIKSETPLAITRKRIELALNHAKFMQTVKSECESAELKSDFEATLNLLNGKSE